MTIEAIAVNKNAVEYIVDRGASEQERLQAMYDPENLDHDSFIDVVGRLNGVLYSRLNGNLSQQEVTDAVIRTSVILDRMNSHIHSLSSADGIKLLQQTTTINGIYSNILRLNK